MSNDTSKLITPGIKFTGEDGKQYETTGEYRPPKCFEAYLGRNSLACRSSHNWNASAIILRELPPPAPPRRVPTDADAIHRPQCWVRDNEDDEWSVPMRLVAVLNRESHKFPFTVTNLEGVSGGCWKYCEIEDEVCKPTIEEIAAKFRRDVLPHIGDLADDSSNQFEGYVFAYIMAHDGWDWSNSRDVKFLEMFSSR
jgi:hypothetical protein